MKLPKIGQNLQEQYDRKKNMGFRDFQEMITEELQQIYGDMVEVVTDLVLKNNGTNYHGMYIFRKDSEYKACPIINLDDVYEAFKDGVSLGDCVYGIYRTRGELNNQKEVEMIVERASDWGMVKNNVCPILLSTEENRELLENLVSVPMLDLSVVYSIRIEMHGRGTAGIKISRKLLQSYGISVEQLHEQAIKNLEKDGYKFRDMITILKDLGCQEIIEEAQGMFFRRMRMPEMYVLTNRAGTYGAAGILNKKLIQKFAGGRDFIILPSSMHETIFVPVSDYMDKHYCDEMVSEVNRTMVKAEERLTDHSYYYDAEADEIRICA